MATIIRRLVPEDGVARKTLAIEETVSDAFRGLEDHDLAVSFSTWDDGTDLHFVCRVETPPGDPTSTAPPWRWWSPLFRTGEELRIALDAMIARRYARPADLEAGEAAGESAAAF